MAHMTVGEVNAWLEASKLSVQSIETDLEAQVSNMILGRLSGTYNTAIWTNETATPTLVRTLISMYYASIIIDRTYMDTSDDLQAYAVFLRMMANENIAGLIAGLLEFSDMPSISGDGVGVPSFFPNDLSSALEPTTDFPSNGPAKFRMGQVF